MTDSGFPTQGSSYLDAYRQAVRQYGPTFDATLWQSRDAQKLRFAIMVEMIDMTDRVIVDAGCALGDMCAFLLEHGIEFREYIGIEAMESVVRAANDRSLSRARFISGDFARDEGIFRHFGAQILVFSGSLNTMDETLARQILERGWNQCTFGLVFNFLSDRCPPERRLGETGPARRFSTMNMLDWALSRSPITAFRQDYLNGHDATIMMRKYQNHAP